MASKSALSTDPNVQSSDLSDWLEQGADLENGKQAALEEVNRLGLNEYAIELDTNGYTVIPPEKVAPPEFTDRMLAAILEAAERRWGTRPDLEHATSQGSMPTGTSTPYMLFEDPVFQEAALNPTALAMATYLVGHSAILYACNALLKGPGGSDLPLHCDNLMVPPPFGPNYFMCNTTWLLTDATPENGPTCFVPGSHKQERHPLPGEAIEDRVGITAPRGSLVVWTGHTWHGGFARANEGLRVQMLIMYARMFIRPQEDYQANVTQEILDRNPARFATLTGQHNPYSFKEKGPDMGKVARLPMHSPWE